MNIFTITTVFIISERCSPKKIYQTITFYIYKKKKQNWSRAPKWLEPWEFIPSPLPLNGPDHILTFNTEYMTMIRRAWWSSLSHRERRSRHFFVATWDTAGARERELFNDNGRLRFPYTIDSREKIKIESCAPFSRVSTMADDGHRQ